MNKPAFPPRKPAIFLLALLIGAVLLQLAPMSAAHAQQAFPVQEITG